VNPINITGIMGSMNDAFEFRNFRQNFTAKGLGVVVKGGEEITLQYPFVIYKEFEPLDYTLAHTVFYESDSEAFSSTFFNQVIAACPSPKDVCVTFARTYTFAGIDTVRIERLSLPLCYQYFFIDCRNVCSCK
jgi:hypothetical protein